MTDSSDAAEVVRRLTELVEWASTVTFDDLPQNVIDKARNVLMDDLGAIIGGSAEPEPTAVRSRMLASGGAGEATVMASGLPRSDRYTAALLNGISSCWLELDGGYRLALCHGGIYTLPAALAKAEHLGAHGRDLLLALVTGYEVVARFARAWTFPRFGLHPHGTWAAVGSTASVAKLMKLNADLFLDALTAGISTSMASPYRAAIRGGLVRNVWTGLGAQAGMFTAEMADTGIAGLGTAPHDVFTGIFKGEAAPEVLSKDLGEEFAILGGYHKRYACCQYAHSALDAIFEMDLDAVDVGRDVQSITVYTHPYGLSLDDRKPRTTLGGKFSMPHAVATGLRHGSAGRLAFGRDSLADPVVSQLRDKVKLVPYEPIEPWPLDRPARVVLELEDGREIASECRVAKGDPSFPLDSEDLRKKFTELIDGVLPVRASDVIRAVQSLEGRPVTDLVRVLKGEEVA